MRWIRLEHENAVHHATWGQDGRARLYSGAPWEGGRDTGIDVEVGSGALRAPVTPSKVLCVGRNYAAHARELGHDVPSAPLLFLKAPSSVVGPGAAIELPAQSERVEFEGEIGVVIGSRARNLSPERARAAIFGFTAVNDVTARDLQRSDVQFTRAKSFDSFCPVGPCIETELDPEALSLVTRVNGEVKQRGEVGAMAFPILELLSYMSRQMTLLPGDLICTGTPAGVGPLAAGDEVEVEVSGLAPLRNPVRS